MTTTFVYDQGYGDGGGYMSPPSAGISYDPYTLTTPKHGIYPASTEAYQFDQTPTAWWPGKLAQVLATYCFEAPPIPSTLNFL